MITWMDGSGNRVTSDDRTTEELKNDIKAMMIEEGLDLPSALDFYIVKNKDNYATWLYNEFGFIFNLDKAEIQRRLYKLGMDIITELEAEGYEMEEA